jgi:hypothetical protein
VTAESIETADVEADDNPPIAHCYCDPCNAGREIATSICGMGHKPTSDLRMDWPANEQHCVVCEAMEYQPCPKCGAS